MILVERVAIKSMDSRGDWGRTLVVVVVVLGGIGDGLRCDSDLVRNCVPSWLEMLPCPRIWNMLCHFVRKCIILVDRVATKSMDSRGDWGRISVRQRSGQKLCANLVGNATLP